MPRIVRCGLIQARNVKGPEAGLPAIKKAMVDKHLKLIDQAAAKKVKILCLQELFYGPYFCAEQETKWYHLTERVPEGPTTQLMMKLAKKHKMVMVIPIYEEEQAGVYYNTAAVIDADGKYLGKYRKTHIPHCKPGFWEKFYFRPGNLGYPIFETAFAKVGVYICYDRHFPEGARALGLAGAEIVFNPSATVAGLSEYLWKLEQPAHAVANGYYVGAINRVGYEGPWNIGEFYGQSYFCDPRGRFVAEASRDKDELVVADLCVARLERRIAEVARAEEVLLPEAARLRNVILAVLAEVRTIGIDHRGGVVVDAGHLALVERDDHRHLVLRRDRAEVLDGGTGHRLGGVVPALVLAGAEVRAVEDFLQTQDLDALLAGVVNHRQVLLEHRRLDLGDRLALVVDRVRRLDQTTQNLACHVRLSV